MADARLKLKVMNFDDTIRHVSNGRYPGKLLRHILTTKPCRLQSHDFDLVGLFGKGGFGYVYHAKCLKSLSSFYDSMPSMHACTST